MSDICVYLGVTGEIGSGKSTVLSLFAEQGISTISADKIARQLTEPGQPALQEMVRHLGGEILMAAGQLDRAKLKIKITQNADLRAWLESLLHPLIRQEIQRKFTLCNGPYAIAEIPLLVSRADYPYLKRILLIEASYEQKIKRLMLRDSATREQVLAMLAIQPEQAIRRKIADDVLVNKGDLNDLRTQVAVLHQQYCLLSKQL